MGIGVGMQCHGCGSTNVRFDPQRRILACNQCGKEEYYSRATLNASGKVMYARQNAINFFVEGHYQQAKDYAQDVLNISIDNAPDLFILAYYDEFILGKNESLHRLFRKLEPVALEYDEITELMKIYLAVRSKLIDYEEEIIKQIAINMQDEKDSAVLCAFFDNLCPAFIAKWPSVGYLTESKVGMYIELAGHCKIPKTCFALLSAIQTNPDSPYSKNTFYLTAKTEYFYTHFVVPVGEIIKAMKEDPLKDKFISAYNDKKSKYLADSNMKG